MTASYQLVCFHPRFANPHLVPHLVRYVCTLVLKLDQCSTWRLHIAASFYQTPPPSRPSAGGWKTVSKTAISPSPREAVPEKSTLGHLHSSPLVDSIGQERYSKSTRHPCVNRMRSTYLCLRSNIHSRLQPPLPPPIIPAYTLTYNLQPPSLHPPP